jgi:hypothetical protein
VEDLDVVPFLERLDLLAVIFLPRLAPDGAPELELMRAQLAWYLDVLAQSAEARGKPLLLLQAGFSSSESAWESAVPGSTADTALQALLYEALAGALEERAWSSSWFAGLFLWELGLEPAGPGERGFRAWGKPAEAFLPAVLGR